MADRRYKLLGQGLPGNANFNIDSLNANDVIYWDATARKWASGQDAAHVWTGEHTHEADLILDNNVNISALKTDDTEHKMLRIDGSNNQLLFNSTLVSYIYGSSVRTYVAAGERLEVNTNGVDVTGDVYVDGILKNISEYKVVAQGYINGGAAPATMTDDWGVFSFADTATGQFDLVTDDAATLTSGVHVICTVLGVAFTPATWQVYVTSTTGFTFYCAKAADQTALDCYIAFTVLHRE